MYLDEALFRMIYSYPPTIPPNSYRTPWLWLDGNQSSGANYITWQNRIFNRMNVSSPLTITMSGQYIPEIQSGVICAKYRNDSSFTINGNVVFVITEDSIYQPVPAGDTWHNNVARDYFPNYLGDFVLIAPGDSIIITQPFTMQSNWSFNQCRIVTWVQNPVMQVDSTKEIYQGATIKLTDLEMPPFSLTVNANGNGSVLIEPNQPNYNYGTWVKLTAVPDTNHHFVNWSDSMTGNNNPDSIRITSNKIVTANFSINTFTINASAVGCGTINPSGEIVVIYGEDASFVITPDVGYELDSLIIDGVNHGRDSVTYTFDFVNAEHTITAFFSAPGWAKKEPIGVAPVIKDGGALVGVNDNYLYAFKGTKTNNFLRYTIGVNSHWEAMESLPFGYKNPLAPVLEITKKFIGKGAALCYDGSNKIYATRGNNTKQFFVYDISTNTWSPLPYTISRIGHKVGTGLAYLNGKVYLLLTGYKLSDTTNFYAYDVEESTWTIKCRVGFGAVRKVWKAGSCLTQMDGVIYALQGSGKNNYFFAYNANSDNWTELESIPLPDTVFGIPKKKVVVKDGGTMASGDGKIYVTKGGGTDAFWCYTPNSDVGWERLEPIPVNDKKHAPKTGAAMGYANGKVWLLTGNKQPDFWRYTPEAKSNIKNQKLKITECVNAGTTQANVAISNFSISPNPFTNLTTIRYNVPIAGKVSIKLFNSTGKLIATLVDE